MATKDKRKKKKKKKKQVIVSSDSSISSTTDNEREDDDLEAQEEKEEQDNEPPPKTCSNPIPPFVVGRLLLPPPEKAESMLLMEIYLDTQKRWAVVFLLSLLFFGIFWNVWQFTLPFCAQELLVNYLGKPSKDTLGASIAFCLVVALVLVLYTCPLFAVPFVENRYQGIGLLLLTVLWMFHRKVVGILAIGLVSLVIFLAVTPDRQVLVMTLLRIALLVALSTVCSESGLC
jgi:hypothetical protein